MMPILRWKKLFLSAWSHWSLCIIILIIGYFNLFTCYFCKWQSRNWVTTEGCLVQVSWVRSGAMNNNNSWRGKECHKNSTTSRTIFTRYTWREKVWLIYGPEVCWTNLQSIKSHTGLMKDGKVETQLGLLLIFFLETDDWFVVTGY